MEVRILGESLPIARWILGVLRDKSTGVGDFRRFLKLAGIVLAVESSRELEWSEVEVTTPLEARAVELKPRIEPTIIGILGASLPMIDGFLEVYPGAPVGLVAARRREMPGRVEIDVYYHRLPDKIQGPAIIVDPMLATGKTTLHVIRDLKRRGASKIVVGVVIAAREGLSLINASEPDVVVYTLAVDPMLNDKFFIVPGLGDAGDRALGVSPS
ncbi:MAG: uracil phosphoribosyltransferase [Desulfurococcales archaeon]|nr:uracil phosphoribosyltransferase [Desulfurococcales archaeon]